MKNRFLTGLYVLLAGLVILSCTQESIFHNISLEEAPRSALIRGSPQNAVVAHDRIYMWTHRGSSIWAFGYHDGEWRWREMPPLEGPVGGLAVVQAGAEEHLFALVFSRGSPPRSSQIMRLDSVNSGERWVPVFDTAGDPGTAGFFLSRLFGAGGKLFAGAQERANLDHYVILAFDIPDSEDRLTGAIVKSGGRDILLRGVAERSGHIYLATAGSHAAGSQGEVYRFPAATPADGIDAYLSALPYAFFPGLVTTGIINTGEGGIGGDIVVVGNTVNHGVANILRAEGVQPFPLSGGNFFSGGLNVWRGYDSGTNDWRPRLLLLGVRVRGVSNHIGYREIYLDPDGNVAAGSGLRVPGNHPDDSVSSVQLNARYRASIGTRAVEFIFQAPNLGNAFFPDMLVRDENGVVVEDSYGNPLIRDWQPPIFASTSRDGLWVYNFRTDRWNAEDNSINWLNP